MTLDGRLFPFIRNNTVLNGERYDFRGDFRETEFAGVTFSPDGQWMFFNIQTPGITFAVTGPWERGNYRLRVTSDELRVRIKGIAQMADYRRMEITGVSAEAMVMATTAAGREAQRAAAGSMKKTQDVAQSQAESLLQLIKASTPDGVGTRAERLRVTR